MTDGDIVLMRWRVGRKVGKNIYAIVGDEPSDDDIDIGRMDSPALAAIAVLNHNAIVDADTEHEVAVGRVTAFLRDEHHMQVSDFDGIYSEPITVETISKITAIARGADL